VSYEALIPERLNPLPLPSQPLFQLHLRRVAELAARRFEARAGVTHIAALSIATFEIRPAAGNFFADLDRFQQADFTAAAQIKHLAGAGVKSCGDNAIDDVRAIGEVA